MPRAERPRGYGRTGFALLAAALAMPLRALPAPRAVDASRPFGSFTLEELMAVEVRAPTKIDQPIREAPTLCAVITRAEMDDYGWSTLGDVLQRQTGFAPSQDFERVTIAARGQYESWNNNHLLILIDGVPANNASNGTAYVWDMFPLSMVESIEIMRGPGSALYGSNATNGVVAINTRKPSAQGSLGAAAGLGDAGVRTAGAYGGRDFPWLRLAAGYDFRGTEGNVHDSYDASGRTGSDGRLARFRVNDGRAAHAGFFKLDGKGALDGLSLSAHAAWWRFETSHGWLFVVPDEPERARTNREILSLAYRPAALLDHRLRIEAVARWQRHQIDYRIKFMPDGSAYAGIAYPDGIIERMKADGHDYFARVQADYRILSEMRLLLGVENTLFMTGTTDIHASNVDLDRGGSLQPFPDGGLRPLGSIWESIGDRPIRNLGLFTQFSTGRILRDALSATAGVRYDLQSFEYADVTMPEVPLRGRHLSRISPRLGLVFHPRKDLTFKAMAERAFRAPAPSELFAANSLLGNSRTDQLQPERITAYTVAGDLDLSRRFNLRMDVFYQSFENRIAFSGARNYSANLYSRSTAGLESELRLYAPMSADWALTGFLNHTWAHQVDEETLEPGVVMSDRLTWAPGHVANAGAIMVRRGLSLSLQGHYQGPVHRRQSDYLRPDGTPTAFSAYRQRALAPWATLDAAIGYRFAQGLRLFCKGSNLLDQGGYLMKPGDFPFDYRIEDRRLSAALEYTFPAPGRPEEKAAHGGGR